MSDVLPKFKQYIFLCFLNVLIVLGFNMMQWGYNKSFDIIGLLGGFATAFIPFASMIAMVFTGNNIPVEVLSLVGIFTGVISAFQIWLIVMMILNILPLWDV